MRFHLYLTPASRAARNRLVTLVHPLDPVPRTAILGPGFRDARNVRVFAKGWGDAARRYGPGVIAGGVEQLCHAARDGVTLSHALIVFTYDLRDKVTDAEREVLWQAFGVPLFEQYLDANHELLAMDCEAHSGLHVIRGCESMPVDASECGCGRKGVRLARANTLAQSA